MIGERTKQARLAAGLTLDQVVEGLKQLGVKVSKQAISNYEKGKRTPNPSILLLLARILKVRPSYFLMEPDVRIEWAAFRCQARLRKRDKESIQAFAASFAERFVYLQTTLFPNASPTFPKRRKVESGTDAERAADELRELWALGSAPIESLTKTIESNGGVVVEYLLKGVRFDGLSGWVNGVIPLIVVNASVPDDRLRLDLAHELGHLCLDCSDLTEKEEERMAFRFAGALLAPASVIPRELGERRRTVTMQELGLLKRKYGISMQALIYRLYDLGIIGEAARNNAFRTFNQYGMRKREPAEYDFVGDEEPTRLQQMALYALAEGIITPDKAEELCPGSTAETEKDEGEPGPISPIDLMKLPRAQRQKILAVAAELAAKEYREGGSLTGFEAFGEDDLHD